MLFCGLTEYVILRLIWIRLNHFWPNFRVWEIESSSLCSSIGWWWGGGFRFLCNISGMFNNSAVCRKCQFFKLKSTSGTIGFFIVCIASIVGICFGVTWVWRLFQDYMDPQIENNACHTQIHPVSLTWQNLIKNGPSYLLAPRIQILSKVYWVRLSESK